MKTGTRSEMQFLVDWLNGPGQGGKWQRWIGHMQRQHCPSIREGFTCDMESDVRARRSVVKLLNDLQELQRLAGIAEWRTDPQRSDRHQPIAWDWFQDRLAAVNQQLRTYSSYPSLIPSFQSRRSGYFGLATSKPFSCLPWARSRSVVRQELRAVHVIIDALVKGSLQRLRRCVAPAAHKDERGRHDNTKRPERECDRWFVATKPWSKACSKDCRLRAKRKYQTSEDYKSRRRKNPN